MTRVPNAGPAERERLALIARLERRLADFKRVPAHRREAEHADEGEQTCRALLAEMGEPGHGLPMQTSVIAIDDLDAWLDGLDHSDRSDAE